jgi:integrase/recombinase XerD
MTVTKLIKTPNNYLINKEISYLKTNLNPSKPASKLTVLFWLRKSESNSELASIIIRLTYNGKEVNRSTGIITTRNMFLKQSLTVTNDPLATIYLRKLESKANSIYYEMKMAGAEIDVNAIINLVLDIPQQRISLSVENILNEFFDLRMKEYEAGLIHISNFQKQRAWNKSILEFFTTRYGKKVLITDITPADAERFFLFLMDVKKLDYNYSSYIIAHTKRVFKWAWQAEYVNRNPFEFVKKKLKKNPISFLTEKEINDLTHVQLFPVPALVRDMFLLQCFTGLSWRDLADLQAHNISILDNQPVIIKSRQKTKVASYIPISDTVLNIISKYQDTPMAIKKGTLLPVHPNQKFNHYLKIVADAAGIKKRLTSHIGRKTFATMTQNNGASIQSISKALGHTTTGMTERHYAVLDPTKSVADIRAAVKRIEVRLINKQAV